MVAAKYDWVCLKKIKGGHSFWFDRVSQRVAVAPEASLLVPQLLATLADCARHRDCARYEHKL